jgi:hypothetical protein
VKGRRKMAYVTNEWCSVCEKETSHINRTCTPCFMKRDAERIAEWSLLSVVEQLNNLRERVEHLEKGTPRF